MGEIIRVAGLFSGSASTLNQIYLATQKGNALHGRIEIPVIIGSKQDVGGFKRLRDSGFTDSAVCLDPTKMSKNIFTESLLITFKAANIDWFGQWGWLPLTPEEVIAEFAGINQHPALPSLFGGKGFYGRTPHAAALYFARLSGNWVTYPVAQRVGPEYDQGELIAATPVQIFDDYSVEELRERVLPYEWLTQIAALLRIWDVEGQIPIPLDASYQLKPEQTELLAQARAQALADYPHG